jgi:hypothetical protein
MIVPAVAEPTRTPERRTDLARAPWAPEGLYEIAGRWVRSCLVEDGCLFSPGAKIWTGDAAAAVAERILVNDPSKRDFMTKLQDQVSDLGDPTIRFTAEMLYMQALPISNMRLATKQSQIEQILGWMVEPATIPDDLVPPLDGGVADFGAGLAQRPTYVRYLLLVIKALKAEDEAARAAILGEPWRFRAFIDEAVPSALMQRGALLNLVFPDTFEYALVGDDKRRIHAAFSKVPSVAPESDDDRALIAVRSAVEEALGTSLNLYSPWFASVWRTPDPERWGPILKWAGRLREWPTFDANERDYKLEIAERMRATRDSLLAGDPTWPELLRSALGQSNNLTHWQWENQPLLRFCEEHPAEAEAFLQGLWHDDGSDIRMRLSTAFPLLPDEVLSGAARVTVVSLLLSAIDVTAFPVYRRSVVQRFGKRIGHSGDDEQPELEDRTYTPGELASLIGVSGTAVRDFLRSVYPRELDEAGEAWELAPDRAEAVVEHFGGSATGDAETYTTFLDLLDEFRVRLLAAGVETRDRLDAQSLVWWLMKGPVPEEWSPEERAEYEAFQTGGALPAVDPSVVVNPPEAEPRHAWLVRGANVDGENLVPEWLELGYVSIGWAELGHLDEGLDMEALYAALKVAYPEETPGSWRAWTGNLFRFLTRMAVGDLVLTVDGDRLYVGRVTSEVRDDEAGLYSALRRRSVEWLNTESPASRAAVRDEHPTLYSRLRTLLTVTDLSADLDSVRALIGAAVPPRHSAELTLPAVSDETADKLHMPRAWLQREIADLLWEKKQLVFYGPPGTGKTLVAQRLADDLVREGGETTLVQFHPSYTYEDFSEGYRPIQTTDGVGLAYELTPGPLRRIAEAAAADPMNPYVLVIDEINRGNIPKIFGELLFLLEYRDARIPLQYSPDSLFGLPSNVFVIATMNTADRSIALVDAALRRRFYFVAFTPREDPVAGVLRRWLEAKGLPEEPALVMDALNDRLAADELALGPSYFITGDGQPPQLERIWKYAVMPLLDEHFYGTGRNLESEFGLKAIRATLVSNLTGVPDDGEEPEPSPGS